MKLTNDPKIPKYIQNSNFEFIENIKIQKYSKGPNQQRIQIIQIEIQSVNTLLLPCKSLVQ